MEKAVEFVVTEPQQWIMSQALRSFKSCSRNLLVKRCQPPGKGYLCCPDRPNVNNGHWYFLTFEPGHYEL